MEKQKKPAYGIWQNVAFMLQLAWKYHRRVITVGLINIVLMVGIHLTQLFLAPTVLQKIEQAAPLGELLAVIGVFTGVLLFCTCLKAYLMESNRFDRIGVRSKIISLVNEKGCTTSYPNVTDPAVQKIQKMVMRACGDNSDATEHIWETLTELCVNIACFVLYLFLLKNLSPVLLVVVLLTTIVGFWIHRYVNRWRDLHKEEVAEYSQKIYYVQTKSQDFTIAKDIRIFGLGTWLNQLYDSTLQLWDSLFHRRARVYSWACAADVVLNFARNAIAYVYLINQVINGRFSASAFLLYFTAFTGFSQWVTGIFQQYITLHRESLDISWVQKYLNTPEPFRFTGGVPIPQADGYELRLENVSFRYPGTDRDIIRNMNLTIRPGEKLAIVGLNGAGKTTLVKLLCGFYDPTEGQVLLNGTDIRAFNRDAYYTLFSAVFQEFSQLDVTVAEEVAQTVSPIDRQKVKQCIAQAGLTEKIESLPNGYDTHLGRVAFLDGVLLSGGETQRLMLARALYKDGPILILDEPTAALDPVAEHDIYTKYNEMTAGKTSVFISHRLASTRFCDRILFLQDSRIAEEGTHESLIQQGGGYAKLFEVQARYYQEGRDFHAR